MKRAIGIILVFVSVNAGAQVWQWSVSVKGEKKDSATAYLWIPETAKRVKGIVFAQQNMEEISIVEHPVFRKEMEKLSFAIIWVSPFFDHLFRFNEGAGQVLDQFLQELASSSGYKEIAYVPIVTMGHSAAASWPYYYAAWNPGRTLCALSVSGQWPWFRSPVFAPDIWGGRNIDFIPCLETMGEYEAAESWAAEGLKERKEHPLMPLSMLACPGEGHFAVSEKKICYLALYVRKAVQYRMPRHYAATGPAQLIPIDPVKTGWLMERWRQGQLPVTKPAPVEEYKGDRDQAFWFFDEELVLATGLYETAPPNRKAQLLGYEQEGQVLPQRNTHLQIHIPFRPMEDGISFRLKGVFLDTVPGGSERPAKQTGLKVGTKIGHAANAADIRIERIAGPFIKKDDSTLCLFLRAGESAAEKEYSLVFSVAHPGDSNYKPFVQQAEMPVPVKNNNGPAQYIVFPSIADCPAGTKKILLKGSSSAGLPVHYFIKEGPAYVQGDTLVFTKIPPRAKFPVKVTVAVWQYGRATLPQVQTAAPVVQSFYITK